MMITVNRRGDYISGSYNGVQYSVSFDQDKFDKMIEIRDKVDASDSIDDIKALIEEFKPLTEESYKDLIETMCPYIFVNKSTNKFYLQYNGVKSTKPLPNAFAEKLIKSAEKNIDVTPLIKCWVRFLRNPFYTDAKAKLFAEYIDAPYTNQGNVDKLIKEKGLSKEKATDLSTTNQVAITKEGLLVCYKVSREIRKRYELNENEEVVTKSRYKPTVDPNTGVVTYAEPDFAEDRLFEPIQMGKGGDAFYCGNTPDEQPNLTPGHFIQVGKLHWLDSEDKVDRSDGRVGVKGLHCGGLSYIQGYQEREGAVTHNIFVDPMDIRAIVGLGNGDDGAMRVIRYFVHGTMNEVNKNIYHSSKYAALTDAEYAKMVEEAVNKTAEKKSEADAELGEAQAWSKV